MADQNTTPAGSGEGATNGQGPAVALQTVYIKDLSFEAPKGPFLPAQGQAQDPKISLNLSTMSSSVGQDAHEVVLSGFDHRRPSQSHDVGEVEGGQDDCRKYQVFPRCAPRDRGSE